MQFSTTKFPSAWIMLVSPSHFTIIVTSDILARSSLSAAYSLYHVALQIIGAGGVHFPSY